MSNWKRKHGILAVDSEVIGMIQTSDEQQKSNGKPIVEALQTIFNQMKIAGNRPRTIDSYEYIFNQFKGVELALKQLQKQNKI